MLSFWQLDREATNLEIDHLVEQYEDGSQVGEVR